MGALPVTFARHIRQHAEIQAYLSYYAQMGEFERVAYYQRLLATANGRYDFSQATLNEAVNQSAHVDVRPASFSAWLGSIWQPL